MRLLLIIFCMFVVGSCYFLQIKQKDLTMLYPDKETPIKYQQDWQHDFYFKRMEKFKKGSGKLIR